MISDLISIKVMNNIFKECKLKLSNNSMQLYQNILQHSFSDKEETIGNLNAFKFNIKDIPNYKKYLNQFIELQKCDLIEINETYVLFKNKWQPHINISRMIMIKNDNCNASKYLDEMLKSQQLIELVAMKLKIKLEEVNELMIMFFKEQDGIGKTYFNESECRKHFIYWSQFNQKKIVKNKVISKSKILGVK